MERDAADALFERRKAEAEATRDDWRSWFRLATSYDAARDRRAIELERLTRS